MVAVNGVVVVTFRRNRRPIFLVFFLLMKRRSRFSFFFATIRKSHAYRKSQIIRVRVNVFGR